MAFDGLFIHNLINEIKDDVIGKRINRFYTINETDFLLTLSSHKSLYVTLNSNNPYFYFTSQKLLQSNSFLSNYLKKHLEGGIITNLSQYNNDRIIIFDINSTDDLGYLKKYKIIIELTGKNSNFIITDENYIITEALKKSYLTDDRIIQVKVKYDFLDSEKPNPFLNLNNPLLCSYEGIAKTTYNEICEYGLSSVLNRKIQPTLIKGDKNHFYCFDLKTIEGERTYFNTLSELIEHYYLNQNKESTQSNDQKQTLNYITKTINKLKNKLEKQQDELQQAKDNSVLEQIASLLAANIHLVKPYQESITVENFYNNNEPITIPINTKISINENINYYYDKYKKNKRAIDIISRTIEDTKNDILYYEDLLSQLSFTSTNDLKELMVEVGIKKPSKLKQKPHILKYNLKDGSTVFVGKNNIQNNYLTHTLAQKSDYFFHVKNAPGSHVILRGPITKENIEIAGAIASYYSKLNKSINVCVDYTQVKWVKKVKGTKGSFVIYTNEKNIFSNPSMDFILQNTTLDK